MRKYLFVIAFVGLTMISNAQWNPIGSTDVNVAIWRNGKIGIGTSTPQKNMDLLTGNNNYISIGSPLAIGEFSGIHFGYLELNNIAYRKSALVFERMDNGALRFAQGYDRDDLYLYNRDASKTFMFWREDGNVGIGTNAPDAKLAVNGTIHTKEVKVDLVGWPDYVFEKDYHLPTLEEIKTYIDKNKHLPEVPSAKEMEANGVQLGEMNMLLLKKIEELTLYVIGLKAENIKMKATILKQSEDIKSIMENK